MSRRGLTILLAAGLVLVLGILAAFLPVPYVVLLPGPTTDTLGQLGSAPLISVTGARTYPTSGHLYLTTVVVEPASCSSDPTLSQALRAWWDRHQAVEPKQVICPPGESSKQVQAANASDMSQSQRDAVTAALLYLGYHPTSEHLSIGSVQDGVPAASVLQDGDAILAIDGHPTDDPTVLRRLISSHPAGTPVQVTIERGAARKVVTTRTVRADDGSKRTILGITLDKAATFRGVDVHIAVDPNEVGGPSAGLAFTLGIVDKLTPGDLTGGRTVAGTGTIDGFGVVGPIGGIQQKIAGATRAGATVFLAPASECADAKAAAPSSLALVKVDTLATAVHALQTIAAGGTSYPHC